MIWVVYGLSCFGEEAFNYRYEKDLQGGQVLRALEQGELNCSLQVLSFEGTGEPKMAGRWYRLPARTRRPTK